MLWTYDTKSDGGPASFHGNVLLRDGLVIVGSDVAKGDGHVYAFNQATGAVRWKRQFEGGVPASIVGQGGDVFIATMMGEAACLADDTGKIYWRFDGAKKENKRLQTSSLLLEDQFVFAAGRDIVAVHVATGDMLWVQTLETDANTTIAYMSGSVYVGDIAGGLYQLSPDDGAVTATFDTGGMLYGSLVPCDAGLVALWWNANVEEYDAKEAPHTLACLDPSLEKIRWRVENEKEFSTYEPLVGKSTVVVGNNTGALMGFRITDGGELWSTKIEGVPRGLAFVDDALMVGTFGGIVYAIDAHDKER